MWLYHKHFVLSVLTGWSKVVTAVPWLLIVWSTLALGTYLLRFISWEFHVIFSFVHFISLYTLGGLHAFRKLLPYNMYLFNLWIANHILIKIFLTVLIHVCILICTLWLAFTYKWLSCILVKRVNIAHNTIFFST